MDVDVIRSTKRRKTVQARMVDGRLRLYLPAWMSQAEEDRWIAEMSRRFERRTQSEGIDLEARARQLARAHDLPQPTSVVWVDNQRFRYGSCSPASGRIRISRQMATVPRYVLDALLVHELAHLVEANHSKAFRALEDRYPKAERARGFLEAFGLGLGLAPPDQDDHDLDDDPGTGDTLFG